jgi:ATP sulfurylase
MRLASGLPWALPVCLAVAAAPAGERVALADQSGRPLAVLDVEDVYPYDKEREAERCFRTTDAAHPGVARLFAQHDLYVAGPVTVFDRLEPAFPELHRDPGETRALFGPREAIWHAICRKNYGCSHFIVGRDHAGVGDYYGSYDAQLIFDEFEPHELDIEPMFFEHAFWCRACGQMATPKTCPHGADDRVFLSGTQVRELLSRGELPPEEFTRPEVAQVLIEAYSSRD